MLANSKLIFSNDIKNLTNSTLFYEQANINKMLFMLFSLIWSGNTNLWYGGFVIPVKISNVIFPNE